MFYLNKKPLQLKGGFLVQCSGFSYIILLTTLASNNGYAIYLWSLFPYFYGVGITGVVVVVGVVTFMFVVSVGF